MMKRFSLFLSHIEFELENKTGGFVIREQVCFVSMYLKAYGEAIWFMTQ